MGVAVVVDWARHNSTPLTLLVTLVLGCVLIVSAAFTVSAFAGLLTAGVLMVAAGHWVTYLRVAGGRS